MDFRILGPLEVRDERGAIALGGGKPRALLAVLLLHANESVSPDRLALALWGEDAPSGATKTVQVHVSRLRKALGDPDAVTTTPAGYRLRVRPGELDAARFEDGVEEARHALAEGHPDTAGALLRDALALWRGPPLADLEFEPFAQAEIGRLEELRLTALELRLEADLAAGREVAVAGELRRLVADHPTRERLVAHLMLALYRSGRQAEALAAYRDARHALVEDAGVEPGPGLQRLHDAVLHQDPSLDLRAAGDLPPQLDAGAAPPLVGRAAELARLRAHWDAVRAGAGRLVTLAGPDGMGKTRLAAELAAEVHRSGARVRYASGREPVATVLDGAREAARPTLLVVDDADETDVLAALPDVLERVPVLVLACTRDPVANGAIVLGPLDAEAVEAIAAETAPAQDAPVARLLHESGGVPGRIHEVVAAWARRDAARRVDAAAGRTAAGRAALRSQEAELARGVIALQTLEPPAAEDEHAAVVCPFKGLASYDAGDAPFFFGRERLVAELVARLVGAPLLGVVGPSGSGKSSVVRAGLLPALADGVLPGSEGWAQVVMRPGAHPMRELHRRTVDAGGRVLVAVDQFEEVFTACRDEAERAAFLAALAQGDDGERTVVLAIRADFYGRCAAYPRLSAQLAAHHVLVGAMRRDELRRAVEQPAAKAGLRVEPELADALVEDVEHEPGALPMLSTALMELWQRRDGRRLRLATYEATGGVRGAVARHAESAFARLDAGQRVVARRVLLRLAADDGEGGVERRRVPLEELGDDADVAALLTDERLLTVDAGAVELAHEALLREWPRLRGWLEEDAEGRRLHRRLADAAREWDKGGRDAGDLYRGARLAGALEWRGRHEPDLNHAERDFLDAAERELHTARAKRRRALTLGVGALVVITGISIVLAVRGIQQAQFEQRAAASRSLAIQAVSNAAGDLSLAGLLGLEAYRREPTVEARSAVLSLLPALGAYRRLGPSFTDDAGLDAVAISPDGQILAGAAEDGTVRLWSMSTHRLLGAPMRGHTDAVNDVRFSADGRLLATAADDETIRLWDVATRRPVGGPLRGHQERVTSVDFSPDGTMLASTGSWAPQGGSALGRYPVSLRLWNVATRRQAAPPIWVPVESLEDVEFSPDGTTLAVAVQDGAIHLFDVATRASLGPPLQTADAYLYGVAFSRDGRTLAGVGDVGAVRLWDAQTGRPLGRPLTGHEETVQEVEISPDGGTLATGGYDGTLRLWSVATHRSRGLLVPPPERGAETEIDLGITGLAFSPRGGVLASAGDRSGIELWDVRPRGALGRPLRGHEAGIRGLAFTSAGTLASGGVDESLRLWDVTAQRPAGRALPHPGLVLGMAATPDGSVLVTAGEDGMVRRWDAASRAPLGRPMAGHRGPVKAVAVSPDGETVASGGQDGSVRLWDARTGGSLGAPLLGRVGAVNAVAFAADGDLVAAAGQDGGVVLWEAGSRERQGSLTGPAGFVNGVAFAPGGGTIAGVGQDGAVWLWDVGSRRPLGPPLTGHTDILDAVAFTPDGRTLATAGADRTIRLWDVETRQALGAPLESHTAAIHALAFSPDGARLASAGEDATVRLWDSLLWSDDEEALRRRVCGAVQRNLTRREWAKFVPDQPYRETC